MSIAQAMTGIQAGQMTGDGSRAVHALVSQRELEALQNKDAALGDPTSHSKMSAGGVPGAFLHGGSMTAMAIIWQTAKMVLNWKREYDAAKAREEDAAEQITRASEDLNLSRLDLAQKYNLSSAEAARYQEALAGSEDILDAKGGEAENIVSAMTSGAPLAATEADYNKYLMQGVNTALSGDIPGGYTGAGDQFATAVTDAVTGERTAATDEAGAMAEILAAADEEVRLGEELTKAQATGMEATALQGGIDRTKEADKLAMTKRRGEAEKLRALEKSRIEGKYKTLAPRVIGPRVPDAPDWISKQADPAQKITFTHKPSWGHGVKTIPPGSGP